MEVKRTSRSHNSLGQLHYQFYGSYGRKDRYGRPTKLNQAHPNNNGVQNRNEFISGIGCPNDYQGAKHVFQYYNERRLKNKVQSIETVLSFSKDDFDFNKRADVMEAAQLGREFFKEAFPDRVGLIFLQQDNEHRVAHIHCVACTFSTKTLRPLSQKMTDMYRYRRIGNKLTLQFNRLHGRKISYMPMVVAKKWREHDAKQPTRSMKYATSAEKLVIAKLKPILKDKSITSKAKFRKACKNAGLRAKFSRRGSKRKGRTRRHNGLAFKVPVRNPVTKQRQKSTHGYVKASLLNKFDTRISYRAITQQFVLNKMYRRFWREARRKSARAKYFHPQNLPTLEKAYPDPADRNSIYQMLPDMYTIPFHKPIDTNRERYNVPKTTPFIQMSDIVQRVVRNNQQRIVKRLNAFFKKTKEKLSDLKERWIIAMNKGLHHMMDVAKRYIPQSWQHQHPNEIKLGKGVSVILHNFDKKAENARIKLNGGVKKSGMTAAQRREKHYQDTASIPNPNQTPAQQIASFKRFRKIIRQTDIESKRREEHYKHKKRQDDIRNKRRFHKINQSIRNTRRQWNQPNYNHIHHDGPTLGG